MQNAKCWLHAYPYYPDRMAMVSLLAAEAGLAKAGSAAAAASAAFLLKQEAQQPAQAVAAAPADLATAAAGLSWLPAGFALTVRP